MTSLRERAKIAAAETKHYWQVSSDGAALMAANPYDPELDNVRDEMDVLALMTDSPMIRALAQKYLDRDAKTRLSLLAVVA